MQFVHQPTRRVTQRAGWMLALSMFFAGTALTTGCADIEPATDAEAHALAELRATAEEAKFAVKFQAKLKKEALAEGGNPDAWDDIAKVKANERYAKLWDQTRDVKEERFGKKYELLSGDVVRGCFRLAQTGVGWHQIDKCTAKLPKAKYDPLKATGVTLGVIVLCFVGLGLYRTSRKQIDPVALAASKLGMKASQERERTVMAGTYKGRQLRIEASPPEAGEGSKWLQVEIQSGVNDSAVVVYGPLAPPHGLQLPDLPMPETEDPRLPNGYRLQLNESTSAEDLLSGDVGFQIREFDPVDVRVHDGIAAVSTWFLFTQPDQVVEFVDLSVSIAECYPTAG